jgi:hypothetical protein
LHLKIDLRAAALAAAAVVTLGVGTAHASNATASGAYALAADGITSQDYVYGAGGAVPQRWYSVTLHGGRSYEFSVEQVTASTPGINGYVFLNLFQSDGTTPLAGYSNIPGFAPRPWAVTPGGNTGGTRATFTYTATPGTVQSVMIQVTLPVGAAGDYAYFKVSVQDTTLFCPWYYTDANFDAFVQIQNVTSGSVAVTLTFYSFVATSGGATAVVGAPVTFTLPAFGATFITAKGGGGAPPGSSGGIRMTIAGPAGSIKANTTTVNTTGVGLTHSFNVAFSSINQGRLLASP